MSFDPTKFASQGQADNAVWAEQWQKDHPGASNDDLQEAVQGHQGAQNDITNAGKTQSQIAAEQAQTRQIEGKVLGVNGNNTGDANIDTYHSPGSADVGGYVGGAKDLHDIFAAGEHNNDAQQAANRAGLASSIANMKGDRGQQVTENGALVGREALSRSQQGQALDLSRQAAMGQAPSAAEGQTRQSLNDVMAGQAGASGAARGLSALGGVQAAGASGAGMQASNAAMAGGMGRGAEVNSAIGMYGTQAGDMRSGDLGRVDQTNQNALANQSLNDNWKLGNAGLAAKQGQLGVAQGQMDDAYYQESQDPKKRQFSYDQQMQAAQAGANSDQAQAQLAASRAESDRNRQIAGGAVQGGLTAVGTMAGGPAGGAAGAAGGGMANSYINDRKNF